MHSKLLIEEATKCSYARHVFVGSKKASRIISIRKATRYETLQYYAQINL